MTHSKEQIEVLNRADAMVEDIRENYPCYERWYPSAYQTHEGYIPIIQQKSARIEIWQSVGNKVFTARCRDINAKGNTPANALRNLKKRVYKVVASHFDGVGVNG